MQSAPLQLRVTKEARSIHWFLVDGPSVCRLASLNPPSAAPELRLHPDRTSPTAIRSQNRVYQELATEGSTAKSSARPSKVEFVEAARQCGTVVQSLH